MLSELYGSPVDVIRTRGRVIVVGVPDAHHGHDGHVHHDGDHVPDAPGAGDGVRR